MIEVKTLESHSPQPGVKYLVFTWEERLGFHNHELARYLSGQWVDPGNGKPIAEAHPKDIFIEVYELYAIAKFAKQLFTEEEVEDKEKLSFIEGGKASEAMAKRFKMNFNQ